MENFVFDLINSVNQYTHLNDKMGGVAFVILFLSTLVVLIAISRCKLVYKKSGFSGLILFILVIITVIHFIPLP